MAWGVWTEVGAASGVGNARGGGRCSTRTERRVRAAQLTKGASPVPASQQQGAEAPSITPHLRCGARCGVSVEAAVSVEATCEA